MNSNSLTLSYLIEQQVKTAPDANAVLFQDQVLSYKKLNILANQFAYSLKESGFSHCQIIMICIERSLELAVTLLALQKLGIVYLPISSNTPKSRIEFIINDANVNGVIVQHQYTEHFDNVKIPVVRLDQSILEAESDFSEDLNSNLHSKTPSYIIYTSGSTGEPKGVINHQEGIINRLQWMKERYRIDEKDIFLLKAPYTFDVSVWEFFLPLICGATLVIAKPEGHKDIPYLAQLILDENVTLVHFVPSMLNIFLEHANKKGYHKVKYVLCSGEELSIDILEKFYSVFHNECQLLNLYGPTEAAVEVSYYDCPREIETPFIPIGKAIDNINLYILDEQFNPVDHGEIGELCIAGVGLATAYLNRPALTAEKFLPNPFDNISTRRLYSTGDLARWGADDEIEFLGRMDHQIKLNGQRIELGEIEAHLSRHKHISSSVVATYTNQDGAKQLIAYVVLKSCDSYIKLQEFLINWSEIYDDAYQDLGKNSSSPVSNFLSWNSSYDKQAIPDREMHHFFDKTVERIKGLQAEKVLEIGCGSGLILFRLLPFIAYYDGSDISSEAVGYIKKQLPENHHNKINLFHQAADNFSNFKQNYYDLIILNSVVQYFPALEYLDEIIEQALNIMPEGKIFIGDVRNYDLSHCFHASVVSYNNKDLNLEDFLYQVNENSDNDLELLISPRYFFHLQSRFEKIQHIEILPKDDSFSNEMSKYRYDVIIHVGDQSDEITLLTNTVAFSDLITFQTQIQYAELDTFCVTNIPSKVLSSDLEILKKIDGRVNVNEATYTHSDILRYINQNSSDAYAKVILTPLDNYGSFSVIIGRDKGVKFKCNIGEANHSKLSNEPWKQQFSKSLLSTLREYLKEILPEYMIPAKIVALPEMPLNTNGKIDRNALPQPKESVCAPSGQIDMPTNKREADLLHVWKDFFGTNNIGINTNFYKLGGDSISSIRLALRLFNINIRVAPKDIFRNPTIKQLAIKIKEDSSEGVLKGDIETIEQLKQLREQKNEIDRLDISKDHKEALIDYLHRKPFSVEAICKLPSFVFAMLYESLVSRNEGCNLELVVCDLGKVDIGLMISAWKASVKRHEILRTEFCFLLKDEGLQIIYNDATLDYVVHDWSHYTEHEFSMEFSLLRDKIWYEGVNLSSNSLMKFHFIKRGDEEYRMIWVLHHALTDGWSYQLILSDVFRLYREFRNQSNYPYSENNQEYVYQYRDFCNYLTTIDYAKDHEFWKRCLINISSGTYLSNDPEFNYSKKKRKVLKANICLNEDDKQKLEKIVKENLLTLNSIMQSIWAIYLSNKVQSNTVIFGSIVSLRQFDLPFVENIVGPLSNAIPIKVLIDAKQTLLNLFKTTMENSLIQADHYKLEYRDILKCAGLQSDQRLYDTIFVFENYPSDFPKEINQIEFDSKTATPLIMMIWPGDTINIECYYDNTLFSLEEIQLLLKEYSGFLIKSSHNPMYTVEELFDYLNNKKNSPENDMVDLCI